MDIKNIKIEREEIYEFDFDTNPSTKTFMIMGYEVLSLLNNYNGGQNKNTSEFDLSVIKNELRGLHTALSRAIEVGDSLKLGIVIGQSITKIEALIK